MMNAENKSAHKPASSLLDLKIIRAAECHRVDLRRTQQVELHEFFEAFEKPTGACKNGNWGTW